MMVAPCALATCNVGICQSSGGLSGLGAVRGLSVDSGSPRWDYMGNLLRHAHVCLHGQAMQDQLQGSGYLERRVTYNPLIPIVPSSR